MIDINSIDEARAVVGQAFGPGEWVTVTQAMIDDFATLTGDHQWIHVDVERARTEMPGGTTIAHGYLVLTLGSRMRPSVMQFHLGRVLNYGLNRLRFITPVISGARIRLSQTIVSCTAAPRGELMTIESTIEVEGSEKPAAVFEQLLLVPRPT